MAKFNCKCYYPPLLFNIDFILIIALALIGYGIFNIHYATTTVFEQCTLNNMKNILIACGCVFIVIGVFNVIECIYTHITYIKAIKNSDDGNNHDDIEEEFTVSICNMRVFIPANCMWFVCIALCIFGLMFTGIIFNLNSCRNTPFNLLMINLFVVGLLPLTIIVLCAIVVGIPATIYGIYCLINMTFTYCANNINNICCFEVVLHTDNMNSINTKDILPRHITTSKAESNC